MSNGPLRFGGGGFGDVGDANVCFQRMAKAIERMGEIRDNMVADSIDVEKYVKELAVVSTDRTKACGRIFEQEHLSFISMFSAPRTNGRGGGGGGEGGGGGGGFLRCIIEHKVIMYPKAVNGDKSLSDNGTISSPRPSDKSEQRMKR